MSTAAPERAHAKSAGQIVSSASASVEQLVQRLNAEVDAAEERVQSLRVEAAKMFSHGEQRMMSFVAVADRVHAILLSRLKALTQLNIFRDVVQTVNLESRGPGERGFHGTMTTLNIPRSDTRPATIDVSFRVGHDDAMTNAVMDYRLQILPIFLKFDSDDQLIIPIGEPNEKIIAAWIDDKLVGFCRTYFDVYFHDEYKKRCLEMDPVMKIRFPRAFAAGTAEYQGRTYHFYTDESFQGFEEDPSAHVEAEPFRFTRSTSVDRANTATT